MIKCEITTYYGGLFAQIKIAPEDIDEFIKRMRDEGYEVSDKREKK